MKIRFVLAIGLAGCGVSAQPSSAAPHRQPASLNVTTAKGRAHLMPLLSEAEPLTNTDEDVYDYGGPILANAKVFIIAWGKAVSIPWTDHNAGADDLGHFFTSTFASTYFSWLQEYNTQTQSIGAGTFVGSYVDSGAPTGTTIDDSAIDTELLRLLAAGSIPANDPNLVYFIYFPANIEITLGGQVSCRMFCAYHGTTTDSAGNNVYYGVMPDLSGQCAACGKEKTQFDNTTMITSHELAEAVTDPAIGVAQELDAAPLAWYNDAHGEIGDICRATTGAFTDASGATWQVQSIWSNYDNACVMTSAAPAGSGIDPFD